MSLENIEAHRAHRDCNINVKLNDEIIVVSPKVYENTVSTLLRKK